MKLDQRQTYRVNVSHTLQFAKRHKTTPTGDARLRDLSDSGCCLHTSAGALRVGDRLALVLDLPLPVLITDARVVWTRGALSGLELVRVSPLERSRLRRFLWTQLTHTTVDGLPSQPAHVSSPGGYLRTVP